jgi:hypothetical protein
VRLDVRVNAPPLGVYRPPQKDVDVDDVQVKGEKGESIYLKRVLSSADVVWTMDGASTLTFHTRDYGRVVLRSNIAKERSTVVLDNVEYTLAKVTHQGDEVILIFEDTAVNLLRRYDSPKKANRDNTTRAQFIHGMVTEVKEKTIPFYCPEEKERQPIATGPVTPTP